MQIDWAYMLLSTVSSMQSIFVFYFAEQIQIDEGIANALQEQYERLGEECGMEESDVDSIVQPIIDSCTKDAISVGLLTYTYLI